MIETWSFCTGSVHRVGPADDVTPSEYQQAYEWYLDLWGNCEAWGFDGLAFAEHHFLPTILSPCPHLLIAAVAQRTQRLRFTTLGSVLAMHDARRYVEECAMLGYITGGRFEPGIAVGSGPREPTMAGIPAELIRPRYYSVAEVLAKAVAAPRITHHDDFSNLDDLAIVPRLHVSPDQSVWVTAMSADSAAWCAERGYKMGTAWMPTAAAAGLAATYREAAAAAGRTVQPSMLGLRRRIFIADTDDEAQEKFAATEASVLAAAEGFEALPPTLKTLMSHPDDYAVGSPETLADRLIEQCRAGGFGVLFTLVPAATKEDAARSHELIGTRLAPILRGAEVHGPTTNGSAADNAAAMAEFDALLRGVRSGPGWGQQQRPNEVPVGG